MRAGEIDTYRPRLTTEQVLAIDVGSKVRDIPGNLYHVVGFVDGKDGSSIAVIAYWHARHQCWRHQAVSFDELRILYTPEDLIVSGTEQADTTRQSAAAGGIDSKP